MHAHVFRPEVHCNTVKPVYNGHSRDEVIACGLCGQVVLIQRYSSITGVAHGAAYSGHYRQVVLIQRCGSITGVTNELAYSDICCMYVSGL